MHTNATFAVATTVFFFSSIAHAASGQVASHGAMTSTASVVTPVQMSDIEFDSGFRGEYQLSTGQTLSITKRNAHYLATIDGSKARRIVPVDRNSFMSADGSVMLKFDVERKGDVNYILVGK